VTRTNLSMSISADGYVAGPNQCEEHPLGVGGRALHEWHLGPAKDHPVNQQVVADMMNGIGATIMGRNMFGPIRGAWGNSDWRGWWGDVPPYRCPVFVLTHHAHDPIEMDGGTTFFSSPTGSNPHTAKLRRLLVAGPSPSREEPHAAGRRSRLDSSTRSTSK
jgi:dihydrofolate reductase